MASSLPPRLTPPVPNPHSTPKSAARSRPSPASSPQQPGHQPSSPRSSPRSNSTNLMDIENVIRSNGGDVRRALEAVLAERNSLTAQNTQLWKLIEKQRTQCSNLASDNDRLRGDRERANNRLTSAGLEPVHGKRMPNSSSVVGLGLKPEHPQIRRHNSDRDDSVNGKLSPKTTTFNQISAPSSPANKQDSPAGLLPSPMADRKSRRESKMSFPPEVTSFISLADSPQDQTHSIPPMPPSMSFNTLSPASQYSASPSVSGREEAGVIPPPSSRVLAANMAVPIPARQESMPSATALAPSPAPAPAPAQERPPRESIVKSPPPERTLTSSPAQSVTNTVATTLIDEPVRASVDSTSSRPSQGTATPRPSLDPQSERTKQRSSSDNVPNGSPRMTPALLPHSRISIPSSTVFPNQSGRDVLCFIVNISIRSPNAQPVTWNVAKLFSAFLDLDGRIKTRSGKNRKEWKQMVAPLPEGRSWKDFAPSKIDQRKAALEAYLQSLLIAPISDKSDLCTFLSTDHVQAKAETARKEGYLTKKGKNFGGWKTRFFVLDGPVMEYFESRGGSHLGSITITNAQIGRQNRPTDSADDRDLRHAFLIIEASKKGSPNRHVLCAESDAERDSWIEVLVRRVDPEPAPIPIVSAPPLGRKRSMSRKHSKDVPTKDVVVTAAQPMSTLANRAKFGGAPSPSLINSMESQRAMQSSQSTSSSHASNPSLSTQSSAAPLTPAQTASSESLHSQTQVKQATAPVHAASMAYGSSYAANPVTMVTSPSSDVLSTSPPTTTNSEPTPRSSKRQSMKPSRPSYTPAYLSNLSNQGLSAPPGYNGDKDRDRKAKSRGFWGFGKTPEKITKPVFAVPLVESISVASVANLPAIVFRSIEYLEAKKAEEEEGIYRLSGSSAVIKGLKDRFDAEGDVNLLAVDEFWDPHAIAGLLKTFLRDLPTSLLTRELHTRFLAVMDLIDSAARVAELSRLVSELPPPNYALLRALTSHLILIVRNSLTNKMTLRNIGIVFSPTLGIPAGIFSELVSHFGAIFDDDPEQPDMVASEGEGKEKDNTLCVPGIVTSNGNGGNQEDSNLDLDETVKRKRNSLLYQAGGADAMLGLAGRSLDPTAEDSSSEISISISAEDEESSLHSIPSSDNLSLSTSPPHTNSTFPSSPGQSANSMSNGNGNGNGNSDPVTPRPKDGGGYPSAAAVRKAKAAAKAAERGLAVDTLPDGASDTPKTSASANRPLGGLPISPRPEIQNHGMGSVSPNPRIRELV